MSKTVKQHIIEFECQGCGKKRTYDEATVFAPGNDKVLIEYLSWIAHIRQTAEMGPDGRLAQMIVHSCNPMCAEKACHRLFQMPTTEEELTDGIDLSKLKVS